MTAHPTIGTQTSEYASPAEPTYNFLKKTVVANGNGDCNCLMLFVLSITTAVAVVGKKLSLLSKLSFIISESKLSFIYAPRVQRCLTFAPSLGCGSYTP